MNALQIGFERWLFPKMINHYWRVGFWIKRRIAIHYDVDPGTRSKLDGAILTANTTLTVLGSDIRRGRVPCHTSKVSGLISDYILTPLKTPIEWDTISKIHEAIDQERKERASIQGPPQRQQEGV
ncbi:MAG: hypothetical protein WC277_11805 [Bacilli bacterium]